MINFDKFRENNLVKSVPQNSYKPHIVLAIVYCILFLIIGQTIGLLLGKTIKMDTGTYSEAYNFMLYLVTGFGAAILVVYAWVQFVEKRSFRTLGFFKEGSLRSYINGLFVGLLAFSFIVFTLFITGNAQLSKPVEASFTLVSIVSVVIVSIGWVIQGAAEEILTRGWLFQVISARYSVLWGAIISSVLFGLLHLANPNTTFLSTFNICVVGFFFIAYALYQGNLWGVCGFHSVWNFVQGNVFGFQVSGQHAKGGSLFYFEETGNDYFTGGAFGPEASLVTSFVLIFLTLFYFKKAFEK